VSRNSDISLYAGADVSRADLNNLAAKQGLSMVSENCLVSLRSIEAVVRLRHSMEGAKLSHYSGEFLDRAAESKGGVDYKSLLKMHIS
jgi:hypothetical protein